MRICVWGLMLISSLYACRQRIIVGLGGGVDLVGRRHPSLTVLFSKKSAGGVGGSGGGGAKDNYKKSIRSIAPQYTPKTANQELYLNYLNNDKYPIVFGVGPAGCGKTLFACITAIKELVAGNVQKIVITRPVVAVEEEELGFLPGNLIHKMDPWTRPIFDIFLEFYQQKDLDLMLQSGIIEVSPLAYMRGRTFKRCFIIADEMQNSSPNQMLMLTTRIGERTKMVITGDLKQSDRSDSNGLADVMIKVRSFYRGQVVGDGLGDGGADGVGAGIKIVEMDHSDIKRSLIVSHILDIYNYVEAGAGAGVGGVDVDVDGDECDDGCGLDDQFVDDGTGVGTSGVGGATTDITIVSDLQDNSKNIGDGANTTVAVRVEKINKHDGNYHLRDCSLEL